MGSKGAYLAYEWPQRMLRDAVELLVNHFICHSVRYISLLLGCLFVSLSLHFLRELQSLSTVVNCRDRVQHCLVEDIAHNCQFFLGKLPYLWSLSRELPHSPRCEIVRIVEHLSCPVIELLRFSCKGKQES